MQYRSDMPERRCPDCDRPLRRVRLLDRLSGAVTKTGLAFTDGADPEHSMWSGDVKNAAGRIHAHLCDGCDRVLFYAERG